MRLSDFSGCACWCAAAAPLRVLGLLGAQLRLPAGSALPDTEEWPPVSSPLRLRIGSFPLSLPWTEAPGESPPISGWRTALRRVVHGPAPGERSALQRRIVSSGLWVLLGRSAAILSVMALYAWLSRSLSLADFGAFFVVRSAAAVGTVLALLGWNYALVRFVAERRGMGDMAGAKRYLRTGCCTIGVSASGWFLLISGLIGRPLARWMNVPDVELVVPLAAAWIWLSAWHQFLAEGLRGCHEQRLANLFSGEMGGPVVNALSCVVLIALPLYTSPGSTGLTLVNCLAVVVLMHALLLPVAAGLLLRALGRPDGTATQFSADSGTRLPVISAWSVLRNVGLPIMVLHAGAVILAQADLWLAGAWCTPQDCALYVAARRLPQLITTPLVFINLTLLPSIAELCVQGRHAELRPVLRHAARLAALPALAATALCCCCPASILGFVFGDDYSGGANLLMILAVGQSALAITGTCSPALTMAGRQRDVMWGNAFAAVVFLSAALATVKTAGATGLAVSVSGGLALQGACNWWRARKVFDAAP